MKKFIYLCGMMLLCMDMMAQINVNDGWNLILDEQFTGSGRGWGQNFDETRITQINTNPIQTFRWCVRNPVIKEGVTMENRYQAYQRTNAIFNNDVFSDNKMRLVAEYISSTPLVCDGNRPTGYEIPHDDWHECTPEVPKSIFYYSGNFQSNTKCFHFGYYEAECAFPVHDGAHAAFWLWGCYETDTDSIYEEIDIVECSKGDQDGDPYRGYSSGVWYNGQTVHYGLDDHVDYTQVHIPRTSPDITQMHTYGCEWMPDHIIFYRDGKVTSEFRDSQFIPQHEKYLKVGYGIEKYALSGTEPRVPVWMEQDTLTINQIKVYQLATDCNTDVYVQNATQLNQINSMKRSITIGNSGGIVLPSSTNKTLRASDFIQINGPFELNAGAELTLMVHECPN